MLRDTESTKRIATIVGWHGHHNAGDDGMLFVLATILRRYYSIDKVNVLCAPKDVPKLNIGGVKIAPIYHFGEGFFAERLINPLLRKLYAKRSGLIVFGGGSIFHSENSIRWKREMLRHAKGSGHCLAALALGVSFGPFPTKIARKYCKDFVCALDGVLVRDKASYSFAKLAKPDGARIALTYDLALLLPTSTRASKTGQGERILGVSLNGGQSKQVLARLLNNLEKSIIDLNQKDVFLSIHLLSFCKDGQYGDLDILNDLSQALKANDIPFKMVTYSGSPVEFLHAISRCDVVIGMRLHSQVFAYLTQTDFLPITYAPKCSAFLDLIGYPESVALNLKGIGEGELLLSLEKVLRGEAAPAVHIRDAVITTEETVHTFLTALIDPA